MAPPNTTRKQETLLPFPLPKKRLLLILCHKMEKPKGLFIDPKMFISKPFIKCPGCSKPDTFGVLSIFNDRYVRRCRECRFTESFRLPKLNKQIIYLDQFAISEMMKAINKKLNKVQTTNSFFLTLFEKLDRLLKLQLIICPDSTFHQDESALYQFEAHRRMYEHLSNGTSFYDPGTIKRFQICDYFRQLVQGSAKPEVKLERKHVIRGNLNDWQERFRISLNFNIREEELAQLKATKAKVNEALASTFQAWKTEKDRKFNDWFAEEALGYGNGIIRQYFENMAKLFYMSIGKLAVTAEENVDLIMSGANTIIHGLLQYLPDTREREKQRENLKKAVDFLSSDKMMEIPSIRLMALLWSALADQFAHGGRQQFPSYGIANDISMVSTILPYSDAMFVDREMLGLLNHPEVKKDIKRRYKVLVFSVALKDEFLEYLDDIEKRASKAHLDKVKEVYGEDWPRAFIEMYDRS